MTSNSNLWKVKLFQLTISGDWIDKGIGFLELENEKVSIFSEEDPSTSLLTYKIQSEDYCKQAETILTWQSEENQKLALSFTDEQSISQFLIQLCRIQGKSPNDITAEEDFDESPQIPIPTLNNLREILYKISFGSSNQLIGQLIEIEIVKKLREIFNIVDKNDLETLNAIFLLYKELFHLGSKEILENLVNDEEFYSVVQALRYDPALGDCFDLWGIYEECKFVDLFGVGSEMKVVMERVARVSFVKETALVRVLNDKANIFLQQYLLAQYKDILNSFVSCQELRESLQNKLKSKDRVALNFFRELFNTAKQLSIQDRQVILTALISDGTSTVLQNFFDTDKKDEVLETLGDFLNTLVDINPQAIVSLFFSENISKNSEFFNVLIKLMMDSGSIGAVQEIFKFIRTCLIPDTPVFECFCKLFYGQINPMIMKQAETLSDVVLIEVASVFIFCVEKHSEVIVDCICNGGVLGNFISLSENKPHLRLQVLKLVSSIAKRKDKKLDVFIVNNKVLDFVFKLLQQNLESQNLIFSVALNTIENFQYSSNFVLNYLSKKYFKVLKKIGLHKLCNKLEEVYIKSMAADSFYSQEIDESDLEDDKKSVALKRKDQDSLKTEKKLKQEESS